MELVSGQLTFGETINLSTGERRVVNLVVVGYTNKQVARKLCLSEKTVKFHLTNVYRKNALKNRAQLVAKMLKAP